MISSAVASLTCVLPVSLPKQRWGLWVFSNYVLVFSTELHSLWQQQKVTAVNTGDEALEICHMCESEITFLNMNSISLFLGKFTCKCSGKSLVL